MHLLTGMESPTPNGKWLSLLGDKVGIYPFVLFSFHEMNFGPSYHDAYVCD